MKCWITILLLVFFLPTIACDEDEDSDAVADPDCSDLVAEIYQECDLRLPMVDGEYPDEDEAILLCKEDEDYDWDCIDDCVFNNKGLCTSLQLCLEDCD